MQDLKTNSTRKSKRSTSTTQFFVSAANIVKKLPPYEQERIESLILDMIREAEVGYQKEQNNSFKNTDDREHQTTDFDQDEFLQRVKFEASDTEISTTEDTPKTFPNSCFDSYTQQEIIPTEQYVVKVIPQAESFEAHEEYIINVLPDDGEVIMPDANVIIKSEPDATTDPQIKDEVNKISEIKSN